MSDYKLTDITQEGLKKGLGKYAFLMTVCPSCDKAFLDGIEGNADDRRCDSCWDKETRKATIETVSMSELHKALLAKGYSVAYPKGFSLVILLGETYRVIVGGDEYPEEKATPDNLSWWVEESGKDEEEEDELTSGGYYDPENGEPFTVETIANLVEDFIKSL